MTRKHKNVEQLAFALPTSRAFYSPLGGVAQEGCQTKNLGSENTTSSRRTNEIVRHAGCANCNSSSPFPGTKIQTMMKHFQLFLAESLGGLPFKYTSRKRNLVQPLLANTCLPLIGCALDIMVQCVTVKLYQACINCLYIPKLVIIQFNQISAITVHHGQIELVPQFTKIQNIISKGRNWSI